MCPQLLDRAGKIPSLARGYPGKPHQQLDHFSELNPPERAGVLRVVLGKGGRHVSWLLTGASFSAEGSHSTFSCLLSNRPNVTHGPSDLGADNYGLSL